jgi:hypothetical protein
VDHAAGSSDRDELQFVDPAALIPVSTDSGPALPWTIDGANLAFERPCDQAYAFTLRMLEQVRALRRRADQRPADRGAGRLPVRDAVRGRPVPARRRLAAAYEAKLERAIGEINAKDARSRAQQRLVTEPGR